MFDRFRSETELFDETTLGPEPETHTLELASPEGPIRIRYWDAAPVVGRGLLAPPPHVVLTHGLFDSKRAWRYIWRPLTQRWRVIAPDLPGMGQSDKPKLCFLPRAERYSPQWMAGELKRMVETLIPEGDLVLVGHSLGGAITLLTLMDEAFARRVRALVLIASAGYPQKLPLHVDKYQGLFGAILACPLWHDAIAAWMLPRRAARGIESTYRLCMYDVTNVPREALEASYRSVLSPGFPRAARTIARRLVPKNQAALVERFREITLPTLVIWGRDDRIVPPAHADRFENDLPNARVVRYDACGHWPQYEHAQETAAEIVRWIDDRERRRDG